MADENELLAVNTKSLQEMFGPRVDITGIESESDINKLDALVFELYKEAVVVVSVVSGLLDESAAVKKGLRAPVAMSEALSTLLNDYLATWKPNAEGFLFLNRNGRPYAANKVVETNSGRY